MTAFVVDVVINKFAAAQWRMWHTRRNRGSTVAWQRWNGTFDSSGYTATHQELSTGRTMDWPAVPC